MKHRIKSANVRPQLVYTESHYYAYPSKHRIALADYLNRLNNVARLQHA